MKTSKKNFNKKIKPKRKIKQKIKRKKILVYGLLFLGFFLVFVNIFGGFVISMFHPAQARTVNDVNTLIEKKVLLRATSLTKYISNKKVKYKIIIYKKEQILEVWAEVPKTAFISTKENKLQIKLQKIAQYHFTGFSGKLGPKNQQGDRQIPEGVYSIPVLNPNSSYHLSIKINYPNVIDKQRTQANNISDPGGLIFIHGKSVTIGCVPIGDSNIEELFYLVSKVGRSKFEVVISPQKNISDFDFLSLAKNEKDKVLLQKKYKLIEKKLLELL